MPWTFAQDFFSGRGSSKLKERRIDNSFSRTRSKSVVVRPKKNETPEVTVNNIKQFLILFDLLDFTLQLKEELGLMICLAIAKFINNITFQNMETFFWCFIELRSALCLLQTAV